MNIAPRLLSLLALSAGILGGSLLASCVSENECRCEPTGQLDSQLYAISGASTWDHQGESAPLPVNPTGGTLETTPDEVVISYESEGARISVVYSVHPEPTH